MYYYNIWCVYKILYNSWIFVITPYNILLAIIYCFTIVTILLNIVIVITIISINYDYVLWLLLYTYVAMRTSMIRWWFHAVKTVKPQGYNGRTNINNAMEKWTSASYKASPRFRNTMAMEHRAPHPQRDCNRL